MTNESKTSIQTRTISEMNFAEILANQKAERNARNEKDRAELHAFLLGKGVTRVDAQYDAYGDSGNVEDITFTPDLKSTMEVMAK